MPPTSAMRALTCHFECGLNVDAVARLMQSAQAFLRDFYFAGELVASSYLTNGSVALSAVAFPDCGAVTASVHIYNERTAAVPPDS